MTQEDGKNYANTIMNTLDRIAKDITDLMQESKMQNSINKRSDKKLENHEKRIGKLELKVKPA